VLKHYALKKTGGVLACFLQLSASWKWWVISITRRTLRLPAEWAPEALSTIWKSANCSRPFDMALTNKSISSTSEGQAFWERRNRCRHLLRLRRSASLRRCPKYAHLLVTATFFRQDRSTRGAWLTRQIDEARQEKERGQNAPYCLSFCSARADGMQTSLACTGTERRSHQTIYYPQNVDYPEP
jgi:hypothetical protein